MKIFLKSLFLLPLLFSCNEEPKPISRPTTPLGADANGNNSSEYQPPESYQYCLDEENGKYEHATQRVIRYYKRETAESCEDVVQKDTLTCDNGTWKSSLENKENYFKDCKSSQFLDCDEGLKHAQEETKELGSKKNPDSESCKMDKFTRTCNNGKISPWNPQLIPCEIESQKKSCSLNGKEIPHGTEETRKGFKSPAPTAGKPCQDIEQTRTCNNGDISPWLPANAFFTQCTTQTVNPENPQEPQSSSLQSSSLQNSSTSLQKSSKSSSSPSISSSSISSSSVSSSSVATQCLPSKYPSQGFSDISTSSYQNDIILASKNGLFAGYNDNTFRPQETISREEIASVIVNILSCMPNIPLQSWKSPSHGFSDVSSNRWSHEAITIAKNASIIAGRNTTTFDPTSGIKKGELASMAFETLKKVRSLNNLSAPTDSLKTGYQDTSSHWAGGKITYLKSNCQNIFENSSSFYPENSAHREWVAKSIYNLMICLKNQTQ